MSGSGPTSKGDASAARAFVVNSLAARAQSVGEIERKLAARSIPSDVAETVIDDAVRLGYLDDAELAGQLARGFRARRYGRRRAAMEDSCPRTSSARAAAARRAASFDPCSTSPRMAARSDANSISDTALCSSLAVAMITTRAMRHWLGPMRRTPPPIRIQCPALPA